MTLMPTALAHPAHSLASSWIAGRAALQAFHQRPGVRQVHRLRTRIRRLQAAYRVFPKACRTRDLERQVAQFRSLFRALGGIRDSDVMRARLRALGVPPQVDLYRKLQAERRVALPAAVEQAGELLAQPTPAMDCPDSALQAPLEQALQRQARRLRKDLRRIRHRLDDPEPVHEARKRAKKLHYLLLLVPDRRSATALAVVKTFQREAGALHDADVILEFLAAHADAVPAAAMLADRERGLRNAAQAQLISVLADPRWVAVSALADSG